MGKSADRYGIAVAEIVEKWKPIFDKYRFEDEEDLPVNYATFFFRYLSDVHNIKNSREFAEKTGLDRKVYSNLYNGNREKNCKTIVPVHETFLKIASAYELSLEEAVVMVRFYTDFLLMFHEFDRLERICKENKSADERLAKAEAIYLDECDRVIWRGPYVVSKKEERKEG